MNVASLAVIREKVMVHAAPDEADEMHQALADAGAILQGHFALQSGAHADHIFRIRGFSRYPDALARLGELLVGRAAVPLDGATLLCPESAGYLLAAGLSKRYALPVAVARVDLVRRPTTELVTRHSVSRLLTGIESGSEVVIVNDVASTGASIDTLAELAHRRGARVRGVLVLATTQGRTIHEYLKRHRLRGDFLLEGSWNVFRPEACPQCLALDRAVLPVAEFN